MKEKVSKKEKPIKCKDCTLLADYVLKEFKTGLCEKHAKKLLTAAMLVKLTT